MTTTAALTIRHAGPADTAAIARLAELDSQRAPTGDVLIAFVDEEPVAAIGVASGQVVADPFRRTLSVVEMLRARAAQRNGLGARRQRVHGHVRKLRVAA